MDVHHPVELVLVHHQRRVASAAIRCTEAIVNRNSSVTNGAWKILGDRRGIAAATPRGSQVDDPTGYPRDPCWHQAASNQPVLLSNNM